MNRDNLLAALDRYIDAITHIMEEFSDAPDGSGGEPDMELVRVSLFPRVAASCLVTTVMEAEKKAGFSFARYAGTGFADFTFPASQPRRATLKVFPINITRWSPCLANIWSA